MTPDSMESRVRALEREVAQSTQRMDDLTREVHALLPVHSAVARIEERLSNMEGDVGDLSVGLRERDATASDERRQMRVALLTLTGVILAALISGVAAVIAAGIG